MPLLLLLLSLLFATPRQTAPARVQAATSAERVAQYYRDYLERLRAVYFAPGDPRATTLLSTATEELSARRKALRAELSAGISNNKVAPAAAPAGWQQQLNELNKTPQAAKFLDRCRRNPALEIAFQRFLDARLEEVGPVGGRR